MRGRGPVRGRGRMGVTANGGGLARRLRTGMTWSLLESWSVQALQFLTFVIVARYVDAAALGLVVMALLVGQFFQDFVLAGIATPLIAGDRDDRRLHDTAFWLAAGAGGLLLLGTLAVAVVLGRGFGQHDLARVLGWLGVVNLLTALGVVPQAWWTRSLSLRPLALRSTLSTVAGALVGVGLAVTGHGLTALVAQYLTTAVVGSLLLWGMTPWRPGRGYDRGKARAIARYGRHMGVTGVANFFNGSSDMMVVGSVLGPAAAGVYAVGKRALLAANLLVSRALSRVALPTFSHLRDDPARLAGAYVRLVSSTAIIAMPAFVGLALVAGEFVPLFFGRQWAGAVPVMRFLTLFGALQAVGIYNHALMLAMGKPHWQTRLALLYAAVNLITFTVAVRYGVAGVALAFTLRAYLLYPLSVWPAVLLLPIGWADYGRAIRPAVLACAGMAAATLAMRVPVAGWAPAPLMAYTVVVGAASYILFLGLTGRRQVGAMLAFARGRAGPAA